MQVEQDRPYFSYLYNGEWLDPSSSSWTYENWRAAEVRGPIVHATGNKCVVLVDELEKKIGSIHLPVDSMVTANTIGTVLQAPAMVVEYSGRLKGGVIDEKKMGGLVEFEFGVVPGDRVLLIRFAGTTGISASHRALGHDRIRLVPYQEIVGVVTE